MNITMYKISFKKEERMLLETYMILCQKSLLLLLFLY